MQNLLHDLSTYLSFCLSVCLSVHLPGCLSYRRWLLRHFLSLHYLLPLRWNRQRASSGHSFSLFIFHSDHHYVSVHCRQRRRHLPRSAAIFDALCGGGGGGEGGGGRGNDDTTNRCRLSSAREQTQIINKRFRICVLYNA